MPMGLLDSLFLGFGQKNMRVLHGWFDTMSLNLLKPDMCAHALSFYA